MHATQTAVQALPPVPHVFQQQNTDRFPPLPPAPHPAGPSKPLSSPAVSKPPTPPSSLPQAPLSAISPRSNHELTMASPSSHSPRQHADRKSPPLVKKPPTPPASTAASPPLPPNPRSPLPSSETPAQLAQLLAVALSNVELYKTKYESVTARAERAERMLASLHTSGGSSSPRAQGSRLATDKLENSDSVRATLDAEARAQRAER